MSVRVRFINNNGGGYDEEILVADGTTVSKFFADKMSGSNPSDYLIRVNRESTTQDYTLKEGDRVSCTPTKVEGA